MLGIRSVASYIPSESIDNIDQAIYFGKNKQFVHGKLGALKLSRKLQNEDTSDMAVSAISALESRTPALDIDAVDALLLVTQNPDDGGLPHTSAIVQGKLGLSSKVACFDVGLGCSGYVYGLYALKGFMEAAGLSSGILVTSDPYSKIIDCEDQNTSMLFGDAATATWLTHDGRWSLGDACFETRGSDRGCLFKENGRLIMNGRKVFNFAMFEVPRQLEHLSQKSGIAIGTLDRILLHQGSAAIIDAIVRRLKLAASVAPQYLGNTGNTVSSSIPLALEQEWDDDTLRTIAISGFGVGLSWASAILVRQDLP